MKTKPIKKMHIYLLKVDENNVEAAARTNNEKLAQLLEGHGFRRVRGDEYRAAQKRIRKEKRERQTDAVC